MEVHTALGDVIEPRAHVVIGELRAPVPPVPGVEVVLQGLDGDEPVRRLGMGLLIFSNTLFLNGLHGLPYFIEALRERPAQLQEVAAPEVELVIEKVECLLGPAIVGDGLRGPGDAAFLGIGVDAHVREAGVLRELSYRLAHVRRFGIPWLPNGEVKRHVGLL